MGLWQMQSSMNRGELDPLLVGRIDLAAYYNGLATATNVLSIPQGGVKKRPGQEFVGEALGNGRLENFSFNVEQTYLLVFTDLRMQVYKDGVLQTNINGSGNDYLVTPWTIAQIPDFDYIQSADTIIITHPNVETRTITRTSDTAWAIATAPFTNIPQFDFNDASSPTPTSEIQTLTFTAQVAGDRFRISLEGILTDEIVWGGNVDNDIAAELQGLVNTGTSGISAILAGSVVTVTFANNSAKDWDEMAVTPISTSSTSFAVAVATTQTGVSRQEDSWSATRGWPVSATFHEGRLWVGGSSSRPATLWGSRVGDFFNFQNRKAFDDEAIEATLDTDQVNAIEAVFSNRSLQIFTSGGEFYVRESPITPSNIAVAPQSNLGTRRIRPVTLEGVTIFVQRTGKAIIQFVFVNDFQANQTRSISFLAPHLINSPKEMVVSRGTEATDANYIYILNDDGELTVFNTLSSEEVAGFTRWQSPGATGLIKSVAVVSDQVNVLMERFVDGGTVYYIERENTDLNTDAAVLQTGASTTITGLDHLEGETVKIKADGAVQPDDVVVSGQVTLLRSATTREAGLEYQPVVKTLPLNVNTQGGPNASSKKKIQRVSLQISESNGLLVNGVRISDRTIGQNQFDAPIPQTGIRRLYLSGWDLEATVEITQDTPMQFNILNIGTEVAT